MHNSGDIHVFRNWDDFEYHFDTSHCGRHPELYGLIIHIFSKKTGDEVWTIGVGVAGRKAFEDMNMNKSEGRVRINDYPRFVKIVNF